MKIPKYVERLIQRRERLAWELMTVSSELDEWLIKNDIQCGGDYVTTGCMIYCEPSTASDLVRQDILSKDSDNRR